MKTINGIIFSCVLFLTVSCKRENTYPEISDTFKKGSWKIAEFIHVDYNETGFYETYKVTFTTLETVTASGINFYRGNWQINEAGELQMDFGKTYGFDRFNATWHITNYNDQMITLDIVGGTDHLVFEKIQ